MRYLMAVVVLLAVVLSGCSKAGSLMSRANGSKQMHEKWKLEVAGVMGGKQAYDVDLWVDGSKFRFQRTYQGKAADDGQVLMHEDSVLYDGSDAYLFHERSYLGKEPGEEKFSNDASKLPSPGAESLQLLTFWKVPDFPYDVTGTEKVGGHECQVLTTTQMDMMRQEIKILCYVDESSGIMRQRLERSGSDSKEALYGTKYVLQEVEMKPTFPANFFKLPADVTDIKVAGPVMKIW